MRVSKEQTSSQFVLETTGLVRYSVGRLSNPDRLYVHLMEATIDPQLKIRQIAVQDPLVSGIQIGVYQDSVTRVVFDLKSHAGYHVSELPRGSGVVVELTDDTERRDADPEIRASASQPEPGRLAVAPSEQQSLSAMTSSEPAPRAKGNEIGIRGGNSSAGNGIQRTANRQPIVMLGSFVPVSDPPPATLGTALEARSRAALGQADFPAATNDTSNATRKAPNRAGLLESTPNFSNY